MQERTWKRRDYFIKKELQGGFMLKVFLTILAGSILFSLIFSYFSLNTLTITYQDSYLRLDKTPKALFLEIVRANGVYIILAGAVMSIISIYFSHRVAGPIFRLEKSMGEIAKGDLSFTVRLRSRDEGRELAVKMNEMIKALSERLSDIKLNADIVHQHMASLSARLADERVTGEELKAGVAEAMRSLGDMRESLSFFKTGKD